MPPRKAAGASNGSPAKKAPATTNGAVKTNAASSRSIAAGANFPPSTSLIYKPTRKSPLLLLALTVFYLAISSLTLWSHYNLPAPISLAPSDASEKAGKGALLSQENAIEIMQKLDYVDIPR